MKTKRKKPVPQRAFVNREREAEIGNLDPGHAAAEAAVRCGSCYSRALFRMSLYTMAAHAIRDAGWTQPGEEWTCPRCTKNLERRRAREARRKP